MPDDRKGRLTFRSGKLRGFHPPENERMSLKRDHFNRKIHLGDVLVFRGITYTWTLQGVPNGSVTVTGCQFTIPLGLIGTPWKVVVVINISMRKWETQFIKRFHHRLYRSCNHAWNLRLTCLWDKIQ